jgi:TonB family protein
MLVLWVSVVSLPFVKPGQKNAARRRTGNPTLKLLKMVEPIYPAAARKRGIRGTVVVEVFIDKHGMPQAIHAVRGNPTLAGTVFNAVRQWRWEPYRLNRKPVEVEMTIAINF